MKSNLKTITLAGNPNVGKSTIFNYLTGLNQHTGNWAGKTVANATGKYMSYLIADIPGTYSLFSNSPEEEIARNFLCFEKSDYTIVVCDATNLERNLNLVLQIAELKEKTAVCINMIDESDKRGIHIDVNKLSALLGLPVYKVIAKTGEGVKQMISALDDAEFNMVNINYDKHIEEAIEKLEPLLPDSGINKRWFALRLLENHSSFINAFNEHFDCDILSINGIKEITENMTEKYQSNEMISEKIITTIFKRARFLKNETTVRDKNNYNKDRVLDRIFTGKYTAIPCMMLLFGLIIWLTVKGANYPSQLLSSFFEYSEAYLINLLKLFKTPLWVQSFLVNGIYKVTTWVIAVMLPPMAIFFPLFTFIEDIGYLPRIAFNLDKCFSCSNSCGKQALTTCMGLGCNAVGVTGCRIIDSPRERIIAILTNSFFPCNGRFPSLIIVLTIFFSKMQPYSQILTTFYMLLIFVFCLVITFLTSFILSKTVLKGSVSSLTIELPPYRTPQLGRIIIHSFINRTIKVLIRAIAVAVPCGAIIWILTNTYVNGITTVNYIINSLDFIGTKIGLDGIILSAFLLGLPANEIVLPLAVMLYSSSSVLTDINNLNTIKELLILNGWTIKTAVCYVIFTLFHWPCSTTLLTIKKETNSMKWTLLSLIVPTLTGFSLCLLINHLL